MKITEKTCLFCKSLALWGKYRCIYGVFMIFIMLIGFVLGVSMPFIASRFGKILPADPGLVFLRLWHKPCFPKVVFDKKRIRLLQKKWCKLCFFSVLWGIIVAGLYSALFLYCAPVHLIYGMIFIYIVCLLIIVDHQYFLLPDFFTLPLLLIGLTHAYNTHNQIVSFSSALSGAWFGYFLSIVAVMALNFYKKAEFGAGDVKMLVAVGAWLGYMGLNQALLLSLVIFCITAFLKRKKVGAYGPALGIASIVMFFAYFIK